MASFSGSKSDVVGSGLAAPWEYLEDPDKLCVLFISLDISRINSARCCELVDAAIVVLLLPSVGYFRSRARLKTASAKHPLLVQRKVLLFRGSSSSG